MKICLRALLIFMLAAGPLCAWGWMKYDANKQREGRRAAQNAEYLELQKWRKQLRNGEGPTWGLEGHHGRWRGKGGRNRICSMKPLRCQRNLRRPRRNHPASVGCCGSVFARC